MSDWLPFAHQFVGTEIGQDLLLTPSLRTRHLRPLGLARGILTGAQSILIEDTRNNPHGLVRQLAARRELTALCVVPITQRRKVIGAIELYRCRHSHQWTKAEIAEVQQVASAIAIAAHLAHLEYETHSIELANATLNAGYGAADFPAVLDSTATALQSLTRAEFAGIHYGPLEELGAGIRVKLIGSDRSSRHLELKSDLLPDLTHSMQLEHPFSISNSSQHPSTQFLAKEDIGALLVMPVMQSGIKVGLVVLAQSKQRNWSTADLVALATLVRPLGPAFSRIVDLHKGIHTPLPGLRHYRQR